MIRKVFKVENNLVVSLPKETIDLLGLHEGSEIEVTVDTGARRILLSPAKANVVDIDTEFARQLDEFIALYRPVLEALAK
ncbi:conserved protein of unknown function [Candidatus Promineifilum breve]|uniref:SpoVT-AbrB domain-containing protein n=1 Tax=Candidatus Promineifilum breve TaxID=1806508 RepID=A0A160T2B3_9CHLR|nr:AbrB/MazE/SpoVT family DNA-binding domain-containing protein [Candidatus Promineifilum breve]CUS03794.2 conserved protein of unknown function [Candidatus Promineifilum breve]